MLDLSIRSLLLEQRFDEAEELFAAESIKSPESRETKRAQILIDTLNGADVLNEYNEQLKGAPPSFEDRVLFLFIARNQLERILQNAEAINLRCQAAEFLGFLRDPGALSALARTLGNQDVSPGNLLVRRAAAQALSLLGGPNTRPIAEEMLRDEDPNIRRSLLLCLGSDPRSEDMKTLIEALQLGGPGERTAVAKILANNIYPNNQAVLRSLLADATETVRLMAARSLSMLGDTEQDVSFLCDAVALEHDPRAARLLGVLGNLRAAQTLIDVLPTAEEETSIAAAMSLGELRHQSALQPLLSVARGEKTLLSIVAIQSIAMLGDASAIPQLVPLLVNPERRVAVAKAIGLLGGQGVPTILLDLLSMAKEQREDWRIIRDLLLALGNTRSREVTPALLAALQGSDERLKGAAAEALGVLGDPAASPALLAALRATNGELRSKASKALAKLSDPETVPGLFALLTQPQLEQRAAAAYPLGVMAQMNKPHDSMEDPAL